MVKSDVSLEGVRIMPGGVFDNTKVVSPEIIHENGQYLMLYIGTSCSPSDRKDYQILSASSLNGLDFTKNAEPTIGKTVEWDKVYSPGLVKIKDVYYLYFAMSKNGEYVIKRAFSKDCVSFKVEDGTVIGTNKKHSKAAHTPKILVKEGKYLCYYTGSNDNKKIFSKRYPNCDFSNGFRIYLSTSEDGKNFKFMQEIKSIEKEEFMNYYGHNVVTHKGKVFLFFTAFDGYVNRIYASESLDSRNFAKQVCVIQPDEGNNEVGVYSCSLTPLGDDNFRIYYGVRYLDNHWTINSATLNITDLFG